MLTTVVGGSIWGGYQLGIQAAVPQIQEDPGADTFRQLLTAQRQELKETREHTRQHLDALALRLGQMQSHILRINALGERLAKLGKLDPDEFNFEDEPALGGLDASGSAQSVGISELVSDMEQLSAMIEDREHKLDLMDGLMLDAKIHDGLKPAGRPVKWGWVSSKYGYRKDPFTGKKAFHHGVDIAGKEDSDVISVAAGIVTFAGKKSGFGYTVEIRHADGYGTRYGHNNKIFVEVGDMVSKGDLIALMGSSGRSTGPHVHFEVARNGQTVNPAKYLRARN